MNFTSYLFLESDTIFISGMAPETTEEQLATHFGSIGLIKVKTRLLTFLFVIYKFCLLIDGQTH